MFVRRLLISSLAAVFAASLLIPAAYAHGCHGRTRVQRRSGCAVCTVEGCELTGRHTHGKTTYCGYSHEDGWCDGSCAALCDDEDCHLSGRHTHGKTTYCGYSHEDGWCDGSCAALCGDEDCHLSGRHTHGKTTYCGYGHEDGWCDGSCASSTPSPRPSGRHHGGCH